ncbi:MAG: hypothetical protein GVY18_07905 [Bacteroidetes bacterium]|jgi:hypothetical protein|nr:hypothetical protein [Bacteroidota bacterium]
MTATRFFSAVLLALLLAVAVPSTHAQVVTILTDGVAVLENGATMGLPANLIVDGTLDADTDGTPTVRFERDGVQRVNSNSGPLTFNDVLVDKPSGDLVLQVDLVVRGLLDVEQGDVDLNGFQIDLGTTGTLRELPGQTVKGTSGAITAQRGLNAPSTQNVAGLGAEITSAANLGTTIVTRGHAVQTGDGNESILRYFDITPTTNTGLDATLTFHYDESELNGYSESVLALFRSDDGGATWVGLSGTVDQPANTVTLTGIDAFSRWTLGSSTTPLPVELTAFEATVDGADVRLHWTTASETNNAGFEVQVRKEHAGERDEDTWQVDTWQVLGFVEGAGTTAAAQTYTYRVTDLAPGPQRFRLKQIDYDGTFEYSPEVEVVVELSDVYALTAAAPNPFRSAARFRLTVRQAQHVDVYLFDVLGRRVRTLHRGELGASTPRRFRLAADGLPSGVYVIVATGERFRATQRVVLLR